MNRFDPMTGQPIDENSSDIQDGSRSKFVPGISEPLLAVASGAFIGGARKKREGSAAQPFAAGLIESLDFTTVKNWTPSEVCQRFLLPLGLSVLTDMVLEHKISGAVLLQLTDRDLEMMRIPAVGDRIALLGVIKKVRGSGCSHDGNSRDRRRSLWEGNWPSGAGYYPSKYY